MENEDYLYLCTMIGNLSGVPVRLYEEEKPVYFHSLVALPKDPFQLVREKMLSLTDHVGFYVTPRLTVSAIGLYLGFSSQGHFVRVFKETVGMTPKEYREKKRG